MSCSAKNKNETFILPKNKPIFLGSSTPIPLGSEWFCIFNNDTLFKNSYVVISRYPQGILKIYNTLKSRRFEGPEVLTKRAKSIEQGITPSILDMEDVQSLLKKLNTPNPSIVCFILNPLKRLNFLRSVISISSKKEYWFLKVLCKAKNHDQANALVTRLKQYLISVMIQHPNCPWNIINTNLLVHSEVSEVYVQWLIPKSIKPCDIKELFKWMNVKNSMNF